MVDFRINWTLPMHSQPPKSPLSGGLLETSRRAELRHTECAYYY